MSNSTSKVSQPKEVGVRRVPAVRKIAKQGAHSNPIGGHHLCKKGKIRIKKVAPASLRPSLSLSTTRPIQDFESRVRALRGTLPCIKSKKNSSL